MQEFMKIFSNDLLLEEKALQLDSIDNLDTVNIGRIATEIAINRKMPVAIEVRLGDWIIYHASLPGSTIENQWWIDRKARTEMLKQN